MPAIRSRSRAATTSEGADELAFLDIRASIETRGLLYDMIEAVADEVFIPLTVGGGVNSIDDIRALLNAGADKVSINTAGVRNPALFDAASARFGAQCIVAAIDAKQSAPEAWQVYTHGGRTPTGSMRSSGRARSSRRGAGEILLTSMDRDGARTGFDLALTRAVVDAVDVPVIASGGVGSLARSGRRHRQGGADAVLAASIFHYGEFTIGAGEGGDGRGGDRGAHEPEARPLRERIVLDTPGMNGGTLDSLAIATNPRSTTWIGSNR